MRRPKSNLLIAAEWLWSNRGKNIWWTPGTLSQDNPDPAAPKLTNIETVSVFKILHERGLIFPAEREGRTVFLLHEAKEQEWNGFLAELSCPVSKKAKSRPTVSRKSAATAKGTESKFQWWFKTILGSGGVIAIIAALIAKYGGSNPPAQNTTGVGSNSGTINGTIITTVGGTNTFNNNTYVTTQPISPSPPATDSKQEIRTFLEGLHPDVLKRIDAGEKEIGVFLAMRSQAKLQSLSEREGFNKYLGFKETKNTIIASSNVRMGNFINELNEGGVMVGFIFSPKDALIERPALPTNLPPQLQFWVSVTDALDEKTLLTNDFISYGGPPKQFEMTGALVLPKKKDQQYVTIQLIAENKSANTAWNGLVTIGLLEDWRCEPSQGWLPTRNDSIGKTLDGEVIKYQFWSFRLPAILRGNGEILPPIKIQSEHPQEKKLGDLYLLGRSDEAKSTFVNCKLIFWESENPKEQLVKPTIVRRDLLPTGETKISIPSEAFKQ